MLALYRKGRQFDTAQDLKEALIMQWEELPLEEIQTLISSLSSRVWKFYSKRGVE